MRSIRGRLELLVALALAGCSNELAAPIPPAGGEPHRGGVLELATFADARGFDPANVTDGLGPPVIGQLFAGLVEYGEDGKIVPELAERWVVEDGGLTYRFFLREGVRFHDGGELTADDVKRSAERALHGSAPNAYAPYLASLRGFADFNGRKTDTLPGVEVEGKYVIAFHLDQPDATFLPTLAMFMLRPVCKSGGARYSDAWLPCGAGPFKLLPDGWKPGHSLTLVRHDGYFRPGLPRLDAVRWTFHQNSYTQTFKFQRGELDLLREFVTPDLYRFQADPRWRPHGEFDDGLQIIGESMNVELPPFDNVEVRRAVAAGIDRHEIQELRAANLLATNQLVPPGAFGFDRSLEGQRFDYAAALEHMRRAGYPYDPKTKTGGYPHVVPYVVYEKGLQEFTGQVLAQQLARIGIRIELRLVGYPTFMALRGRRKTSAFGPALWQQDYPDALSFLEPLFHTKSISEEDSTNWSFYSSPRFDEVVTRARRELDDGRRKALYDDAQKILFDDAPWAFTETFRWYTQRQAYVREYRAHPLFGYQFTRTWLDRAAGPIGARVLLSGRVLGDRR